MFWKKKPKDDKPAAPPPPEPPPRAAAPATAPVADARRQPSPSSQPGAPTGDLKPRVIAGLDRAAGDLAALPSPESAEARSRAVDALIADPALRGVAQDFAEGRTESAFEGLERHAQSARDAAKWALAGALMYGVDAQRAKKTYEQAFAIDQRNFWVCMFTARLRGMARDLEGANAAAAAAILAGRTPDERGMAFSEAALVEMARENFESAIIHGGQAVEASRGAIRAGQRDAPRLSEYVARLTFLGDANVSHGAFETAHSLFEEALSGARKLSAAAGGNLALARGMAEILEKSAATSANSKDHVRAIERAEEAVSIRRRLSAGGADAGDKVPLASALNTLGEVQRLAGKTESAKLTFKEALDIARAASARDPSDFAAKREVWSVLWRLATMGDTGVTWKQVADAMEMLASYGGLNPGDQRFYDEALKRAGGE